MDHDAAEAFDEMAATLKLLGDRTRLTMLALMREGELCVCDIADALETSQPNASQHLRKLKAARLVREARKGQWIYYSLALEEKPYVAMLLERLPSLADQLHSAGGGCCPDGG
ncbi:winged helix-turn-helix transcriptional regulator [Paenibacillus sp. IB182496]|uniref:Winged helix-turn-helix transcriptional regulator n=2 Tax=Paenibacillus sabuli TaxID=2772509 RepID=A0A927BXL5_9BACL|nr:metalloregulator ArsR/SmtB family transcription factor [Paenibacillus sabuli]MBD2847208.1 winged helix-turn-helix transcriptional regulator [Paenibacillus sabuli]